MYMSSLGRQWHMHGLLGVVKDYVMQLYSLFVLSFSQIAVGDMRYNQDQMSFHL